MRFCLKMPKSWHLSIFFWFSCLFVISGCATSTTKAPLYPPISELNTIQSAFDRIVAEIYSRDWEEWHHGPFGNFIIYWKRGNNRGYCHEWQTEVFEAITPLIHRLNWQADKISVGLGTSKEHHVVLVYDPTILTREKISASPRRAQAFVLDAWYHGRSDIYQLKDWLSFAFEGKTDFAFEGAPARYTEETLTSEASITTPKSMQN
jgi:hypothetical protein